MVAADVWNQFRSRHHQQQLIMDAEPVISRAEFAAYGGVVSGVGQHLVGTAFVDAMNMTTFRLGELATRWVLDLATFTDGSTADAYDTLSIHPIIARDGHRILWLDSNGNMKVGEGIS